MDLINRLFFSRPKLKEELNFNNSRKLSQCFLEFEYIQSKHASSVSSPYPFRLDSKHVRVLLFRECDRRGRKLLYDSRTVTRLPVRDFHHSHSEHHPQCKGVLLSSTRKFSQTSPSSPKHCLSSANFPSNQPCCTGTKSTSSGTLPKYPSKKLDGTNAGAPSFKEVRNGFGYQYQNELPDTKQIGEHVFGAVAMAYRGPSAKIHVMSEPSGILISRTCGAPRCYKSPQTSCDNCLEGSFSSLSSSLNDLHMTKVESLESSLSRPSLKPSVPVEMYGVRGYGHQSEEDSGYSGPPSPFSSTCGSYLSPASLSSFTPSTGTPNSRNGSGSSLKNSGSSISSLQRRFLRNVSTSLDSFGFRSGAEEEHREETSGSVDRKRLGIAVFIETKQGNAEVERQLRQWLFNFQDAFELSLNKLQSHVETAYLRNSTFVSAVYQAVSQFQQELCDLVCAPRLQDPLWLSLYEADSENEKEHLYSKLAESLSFLLNKFDTKDTNFFISKLLTAVLTHHLGWVSTVAPQTPPGPSLDSKDPRHSSSNIVHDLGNCFSKSQPYNALWGQLYELTGSIGYPSRMTKTVIVGSDCTILNQILILLSYFIRCSKVEEKVFKKSLEGDDSGILESSKSKNQSSFSSSSSMVRASPVSCKSATLVTDSEVRCSCKITNDIPDCSLRVSEEISVINDLSKTYSAQDEKTDHKCRQCGKKPVIIQSLQPTLQKVPKNFASQSRLSSTSEAQLIVNTNQGLNTSKTMSDLASLCISEGVSPTDCPVPFSPLYPNLKDIQDHNHRSVESTENIKKLSSFSPDEHSCKVIKASVASGEKIDVTFEKGGKVIFILGENERLEGLRPKKVEPDSSISTLASVDAKSTDGVLVHGMSSKNSFDSFIMALPPPVDNVRIGAFRRQGKSATALDRKSLTTNKLVNVYPSLEELKKELVKIPSVSVLKKNKVEISSEPLTRPTLKLWKNHRRVMSDPTMAIVCFSDPINVGSCDETLSAYDEEIISKVDVDTCESRLIKHTEENDENALQTVKVPSVEIISQSSPQVAESLMGGILDHYSSIFVLHATTNADKLEDQLRIDLLASSQNPVLDSQTLESCAIVAGIDRWEIELVSSHSYAVERRTHDASSAITFGGIPIMISPLISQITDSISHLVRIGAPSQFVANCMEHSLRDVYLKSQLLSQYLLEGTQLPLGPSSSLSYFGGKSLYNLSELTQNLGIDLNDLPLLLSVASTHTPALTRMFGLTFN